METKGIIISKKDYERLTDIEKNFDEKVKENKELFRKGLEDAIKGNLVKILWIGDKYYAKLKGCDLSDEGIDSFISREDADFVDKMSSRESYDREKIITTYGLYQEIIDKLKKTIRNLWWAFGMMFVAWIITYIAWCLK